MKSPLCKNPANKQYAEFLFSAIFSMTFITLFLFQYSCKRYDIETELKQVDSLITLANSSLKLMVVDADLVRSRIDSMQIKIDFINELDTGRMSQEFRTDVSSYKALFVNYGRFVTQYEALDFDSKKYLQQAESLKINLIDRKIDKEEFSKTYTTLNLLLGKHYEQCQLLVKDIFAIEPMYQRLNNKITDFYQNQARG